MKEIVTICSVAILLASCGGAAPQNKHITYQNIVILADMSSRIKNKPPKDINEIHRLVQIFRDTCVKPGEKIGDKSCISFSTFSKKVIACIDIDQIKDLGEKQQFINSTGRYQNSGLEYQIGDFEHKVRDAYTTQRNNGLDLISVLIDKIENESIIKKDKYLTDGIDTTFINYDNHMYIFTDGYLEYIDNSSNRQFYFGSSEIDKVRQFCKANNVDIAKAIEINKSLCLQPSENNKNRYINLHVLETHERDKDDILQTYKYPTGQRDNEILAAVWQKWANESGFKSFEWKKY